MLSLFAIRIKERPNWHVQAFITDDAVVEIGALRRRVNFFKEICHLDVYVYHILMLYYFRTCTNCMILLCVWHVRRAWLKNVGNKVKGRENNISIFRTLGEIMHSCQDDGSVQHEIVRFLDEFREHKRFLDYFRTTWLANDKICKFF